MENDHCEGKIGGIVDETAHRKFLYVKASAVLITREDRAVSR
jgi:hypothetical protein